MITPNTPENALWNSKNMNKTDTKTIKIANLELNSCVSLAPMAGITDSVQRQLIRKYSKNCLLTTEMISSEALVQTQKGIILHSEEVEAPLTFQLSGHKPHIMAKAAAILKDRATIIDINMGCPVNKIVNGSDGCALMRDSYLASDIVKAVKDAVDVPVTCKFRLGWHNTYKNFVEFAQSMQEAGADAITVHARTKIQMYSGKAEWAELAKLKGNIDIPVFANGDVVDIQSAIDCLALSKADGLAIGRGAIGNPDLLARIEHYCSTGEIIEEPSLEEKIEILKQHLDMEIALRGEEFGIKFMRKFYPFYIKGARGCSEFRYNLVRENSYSNIIIMLDRIKQSV